MALLHKRSVVTSVIDLTMQRLLPTAVFSILIGIAAVLLTLKPPLIPVNTPSKPKYYIPNPEVTQNPASSRKLKSVFSRAVIWSMLRKPSIELVMS